VFSPLTETIDHDAIRAHIQKNYRWNFLVNTLDEAYYSLGMSFFSTAIVLPLFVSHFTSSPLAIGLIAFLSWAGTLLPPLFVANRVERAPIKKIFPVGVGFFAELLPMLLLAPAIYLLSDSRAGLTLAVFFFLFAWANFGDGVILVGWEDMIAKIIPTEKRGRFFGITNFVGGLTGLAGALAVTWVLDMLPFPLAYIFCFGAAGVLSFIAWLFAALTREPAVPSQKPPVSQLAYLRSLPGVLRRDQNFRMYLISQIIFALSGMATGFLAVYSVQRWGLTDAKASGFLIAMQAGLMAANLLLGFLSDRKGHKLSLEICFGFNLLALVLAVIAQGPLWFYVIFFLRGVADAGLAISGVAIVYEFTNAENRPTYLGLANTIPGLHMVIAPLLGGWLAGAAGYPAMFAISTLIGVVSWGLLHYTVREPRLKTISPPTVPISYARINEK